MSPVRLAYKVHSWAGLLTGWLLFVLCLTGTIVVYKYPLKAFSNASMSPASATADIGPDRVLAAFRAQRPDHRVSVVAFPSDTYSIHQYSILAFSPQNKRDRYWIDPSNGAVRDELESDFADFVQRLHATLYFGPKPGRVIVGVLGVLMLASIVSGLVFHWRRLRKDLFHLRLDAHARKAWSDVHKAVGVWTLPFAVIIALTGAWLGVEVVIKIPPGASAPLEVKGERGKGQPLLISRYLANAQALRPDLAPSHINFTQYGVAGSTVRVQGDLPGWRLVQRGQTMLVFDADTGRHLQTVDRTQQGIGRYLLASVRPLHYGYFGSGWSEALYFILGGASTIGVVSGLVIWTEREKRKTHPQAGAEAGTVMERANVAVMGGLIAALTIMAALNAAARAGVGKTFFGLLGGLGFTGSQDLLATTPQAIELSVFGAIWLALGLVFALLRPVQAWCACLISTAVLLIGTLVLTVVSVGGVSPFFNRPDGEGFGFAIVYLCLAGFSGAVARRLTRAQKTSQT